MEEQEVVAKAEAQGWVPQDKYKGDPDHWVDAETFVQRGEQIMPILRKNNENLLKELREAKDQLTSFQKTAQEWREFQKEAATKKITDLEKQITALKVAKKEALDSGDSEKVIAIDDALDNVKEEHREAKQEKKVDQTEATQAPKISPELQVWIDKNPWFGKNIKKTSVANGLGDALRREHPDLVGNAFLEALDVEIAEFFGEEDTPKKRSSPVEGSSRGEGGVPSNAKHSYANLPAEAKAACDRFVKDKVCTREQYVADYPW